MKKSKFINYFIAIILSVFAINMQAQIGKLGKNLQREAKEKIHKVENKTDNTGYSDNCLRLKKNLENRYENAQKYLNESNLTLAGARTREMRRFIDEYKGENCPFASGWETKYDELNSQLGVSIIKDDPQSFLISAVEAKDQAKIEQAISNGADINKIDNQTSALYAAIEKQDLEMVKYLIEKGADVNIDNKFSTPLEESVNKGNFDIFKYLLEKGAKTDACHKNIVLLVAYRKNLEMMKELSEGRGVDITVNEADVSKIPYLQQSTALLYVANSGSELEKYIIAKIAEAKQSKIKDEVHKKFMNRIVFSSASIPAEKANSSSFSTNFEASKNIFARIYLGSLYSELFYGTKNAFPAIYESEMSIWAQINGDTEKFNLDNFKVGGKQDAATYDLKVNTREFRASFHEFFIRLKTGENKVTIWATVDNETAAKEELTLSKKPGDFFKVGKSFADFKAGMKNPSLEASFLKTMQTMATNSEWKENFKQVKIASTDWTIIHHDISGRILGRYITAYCYAQWPDGHCTVQAFSLKQEYNGSTYSNTLKSYSNGSQEVVDCN
jgi:ankyrin repeat protein